VLVLNPCVLPDSVDLQLAGSLGGDFVHVHRPIAALCRNVLVHGIPGDTLYIVVVFHDLFDAFPVACGEDSRDVISTAGEEVFPSGTPCEIVDLHCGASVELG
jgi:hypothetical protein